MNNEIRKTGSDIAKTLVEHLMIEEDVRNIEYDFKFKNGAEYSVIVKCKNRGVNNDFTGLGAASLAYQMQQDVKRIIEKDRRFRDLDKKSKLTNTYGVNNDFTGLGAASLAYQMQQDVKRIIEKDRRFRDLDKKSKLTNTYGVITEQPIK